MCISDMSRDAAGPVTTVRTTELTHRANFLPPIMPIINCMKDDINSLRHTKILPVDSLYAGYFSHSSYLIFN